MPARRSVACLWFSLLGLLITIASPSSGPAQQTTRSQSDPRPVAQAVPRQGEIAIDGRLDDAAWAAAKPITELIQAVPNEGKAPTQRTEIRILYDAGAIYIGDERR
jgi:hypothetical protein